MLIDGEFFLSVLFELTLFALLVICVYKLFKQYLIPALYEEIDSIKKVERDLKDKGKLLLATKKRLEGEISEQSNKLFLLEEKIQLWHKAVIANNKAVERENAILLKEIKAKREKQEENLKTLRMEMAVIPHVIEETYNQIKEEYSGEKGLKILRELIEKIQPE